jgi:mono/diheme cytochrome c family protein
MIRSACICIVVLCAAGQLFAAGSAVGAESGPPVDVARQVHSVLASRCAKCHGPEKREAGLRLDVAAEILRGGDNGPVIVPRNAAESRLIIAISGGTDEISRMPPEGSPLDGEQIGLIRAWIEQGASFPAADGPSPVKSTHWAFQRPEFPRLPDLEDPTQAGNAIDAFVLARLESQGLAPSAVAERATLIRRLSLDLLGLLPSASDVSDFVGDAEPQAYERLVDRLLSSPAYGERWGRHWLDAARYADSNGYTRDFGREIWKYREWVIEAINRDLPFDQFVVEQIAGDMLDQPTQGQLIATGFHRNTLINEEGGTDQEQFRVDAVADRLATTGEVLLGLTLGCARCHTHKYDPISQREYYQLFAFLNNCDEPTLEVPAPHQVASGELERRETIRQQIAGLEKQVEEKRAELDEKQQAWEKSVTPQQRARLPGPVQVAFDMPFEKRDAANKKIIEEYYRKSSQGRHDFPLLDEIARLRDVEPKIPTTMVMAERREVRPTHVHRRGDFLDRGEEVLPAVPAVLHPLDVGSTRPNRLDFARWIVSPASPLTPRVIVNRYWQHFFGRAIVETENDFGTQGTPPSHPELLDWLASEFVGGGWSVKRLHRLIVTSATYRQSSLERPDIASVDPQNRFLGRQNRIRLDAEIIRDAALTAGGLLARRIGGPSVYPPQPDGVFEFTQDPKPWPTETGENRFRRGMYTFFWRSSPYPALMLFDAPNGNVTCTRRVRSNTPLQALTLANDVQFVECAQALARRVLAECLANPDKRLEFAFTSCLARNPSPAERRRLHQLLQQQRDAFATHPAEADQLVGGDRDSAPHAENPELAAWTAVCRVLLNLDEFITRE